MVMDAGPLVELNWREAMSGFRDSDTTITRRPLLGMGARAYGVAAIVLGLAGFVWGDFATNWQRVGPNVPYREALAYFTAAFETIAGLAMLWHRSARAGALLLTILYSIFTLLWVIQVCAVPGVRRMGQRFRGTLPRDWRSGGICIVGPAWFPVSR